MAPCVDVLKFSKNYFYLTKKKIIQPSVIVFLIYRLIFINIFLFNNFYLDKLISNFQKNLFFKKKKFLYCCEINFFQNYFLMVSRSNISSSVMAFYSTYVMNQSHEVMVCSVGVCILLPGWLCGCLIGCVSLCGWMAGCLYGYLFQCIYLFVWLFFSRIVGVFVC